jgi:hypothetical protein
MNSKGETTALPVPVQSARSGFSQGFLAQKKKEGDKAHGGYHIKLFSMAKQPRR